MPDILTVQDAMARVMGDVREVAKTDRNQQQNFSFRGVDAVVNAVAPALRRHGLVVLPRLESIEYENVVVGRNQTHMIGCRVRVTYVFVGPGGDKLEATVAGEAMDSGDKATAKAMSVAFRIALLQALALPTDDADPDAASYERTSPAPSSVSAPGTSDQPAARPGLPAAADGGQAALADADDRIGEGAGSPSGAVQGGGPPHSPEQWQRLVAANGGSEAKALNRLNRVNQTSYTKHTVEFATADEVAAAITGERVA